MSTKQKSFTGRSGEGDSNLSQCSEVNRSKRPSFETGRDSRLSRKDSTPSRKFCQGQLVYVKDEKKGWISGNVMGMNGNFATVALKNEQAKHKTVTTQDILLRSENSNFLECENLTEVTPVNEASVLDCLHQRYLRHIFYTAAGTTIVAVNPFKDLPQLYNYSKIQEYHQAQLSGSPHIYIIAEKAYSSMVQELGKINQSIIVSGESGAGKTVTAKHLLRYLTIVSSPEHEINLDSSFAGSAIERSVLDSNPILEAFGNAATPRNENSSRFGKFIQLQFHRNGYILGGVIQTYLLEKTRVVHQGVGENNFHIFYQLLSVAEMSEIPEWLEEVKRDVCNSKLSCSVPQQTETLSVLQTVSAMADIGVPPATQVALFQVLLAILHLTTLKFNSTRDEESSSFSEDEVTQRAKDESSRLLSISPLSLHQVLINRNIVSGGKDRQSIFVKPVSVSEAQSRRDCLAMLLYARLFDWVVRFINKQIEVSNFDHSINLLDIYGFEVFSINSLEQLCINYANERLQQHYVTHFLRELQSDYEIERIPWTNIIYRDNRICVEALDGPAGVFGVLNEEVSLNRKSNNSRLCGRIVAACGVHGVVRKPHASTYETKFCVRHYAGEVLYTVDEAVIKNRDNIPVELITLLGTSSNPFILSLFSSDDFTHTEQSLTPTKIKKKKTLLMKFKSSLDSLMSTLSESEVHYVRCIKPNTESQPDYFDRLYVVQQLQACGTLETVDICRRGYPARMMYQDFAQRYGVFLRLETSKSLQGKLLYRSPNSSTVKRIEEEDKETAEVFIQKVESHLSYHDGHFYQSSPKRLRRKSGSGVSEQDSACKLCARIIRATFTSEQLQQCHLQFGLRKIFLTQTQLEHLEHSRAVIISYLVARVQAHWRAYVQYRRYEKMKRVAVKLQAVWRGCMSRQHLCDMKRATEMIQKAWRVYRLRMAVKKLARSSRIVKRVLTKWVVDYRIRTAHLLQIADTEKCSSSSEESLTDQSESLSSSETTTFYVDAQESLHDQTTTSATSDKFERTDEASPDDTDHGFDDSSGSWSDDSGVMIKDEAHKFPEIVPSLEAPSPEALSDDHSDSLGDIPPAKKPKLNLRNDLRMGNGVVTCRRLTKPGFRFHVRKSVLKHGHLIHYSELPHGLSDALLDEATGMLVNPHSEEGLKCNA